MGEACVMTCVCTRGTLSQGEGVFCGGWAGDCFAET